MKITSTFIRCTSAAALAMLATVMGPAAHAEGSFAQLYAARPPAGSSFVRVIHPGATPVKVKIANGPEQNLGGAQLASSYAIVKGGTDFQVTVNGKSSQALQVKADTFTSLVWDGARLKTLDDSAGSSQDALKAEIRFYNLVGECSAASLRVAPAGPDLAADVAPWSSKARAINPVKATLHARCGASQTADVALPELQPGDHYGLFLTGSAQVPQLQGLRSTTDSYKP